MKLRVMLIFAWPCMLAAGQDGTADMDRLQGVWQAVSIVDDGAKAPDEAVKQAQMIIKGNQFVFKGEESYRGTLALDSTKKPKWITTTFIDTDNKEGGKALGIYELSGDELKIAWRQKGERPTDFNSADKSGVRSIVLQRRK